jgi:hypothetical protein
MNPSNYPRFSLITMIVSLAYLMIVITGAWAAPQKSTGGAAPLFTAADAKTLRGSDPDAVANVLAKLTKLNQAKGKDALKPAVDPLIESAWNELKLPEDQRWNLMDIIKVLSLAGDPKSKPLYLHLVSTLKGAGNPYTAQAFLLIGSSTVKDLADSLQSKSPDTRSRAALTLLKMAQYDKSGSFFPAADKETIKTRLVANLKDPSVQVRIYSVSALGSFGDTTVIPLIEQIEKKDAYKDSGGVFEVRVEATEALKKLRAKK